MMRVINTEDRSSKLILLRLIITFVKTSQKKNNLENLQEFPVDRITNVIFLN